MLSELCDIFEGFEKTKKSYDQIFEFRCSLRNKTARMTCRDLI